MSFFSILGGWSMVMDSAQKKITFGKKNQVKRLTFSQIKSDFCRCYSMKFLSENGHARSMNIDFKIENMSYLSPNNHNLV